MAGGLDIACGSEDGDIGERVWSRLSIGEDVALLVDKMHGVEWTCWTCWTLGKPYLIER